MPQTLLERATAIRKLLADMALSPSDGLHITQAARVCDQLEKAFKATTKAIRYLENPDDSPA